jgi:hypothetical protein
MQRKISKLVVLFFLLVRFINAEDYWLIEKVPLVDELKNTHNINSYFASMNGIEDYVAISVDMMLFAISQIGLALYDFKQKGLIYIPPPFDFYMASVWGMAYDKKNNTVHMVVRESLLEYYYVLNLDTYSWNKIEELSYPNPEIFHCYYDFLGGKIYYETISHVIKIFDFQTREVVDEIRLFENEWHVEAYYENPVRILGQVRTGSAKDDFCYFVYDFRTRTREIFHSAVIKREASFINEYVPLDGYRFLGINVIRLNLSEIIEIDLFKDTYRTVAFDDFRHYLFKIKRNHDKLMNFIVVEETGILFRKPRYIFCSWEYPE